MRNLSLIDIVDLSILQEIQDNFSDVTKLATVIVDYRGIPITKYSNYTDFCKNIRGNEICRPFCFKSDADAGRESTRLGRPYIYKCYAGLVDISIPIIFQKQILGYIQVGQVKVEDAEIETNYLENQELVRDYINTEEQRRLYDEITTVDSKTLENAISLINILANYIVRIGASNLAKDELNKKNERLKKEMEIRLSMEKLLRESELKVLKSQVNPHFLFNILNNINNLAMLENAHRTSEVVYSLTDMLRYTMKNDASNIVTIEKELNYASQYLKIQKIRFGKNLDYELDIDEGLLDVVCPFMIIQPLVANAIDHGLFKKDNKGKIWIRVFEEKGDIIIQVKDNGVGMDKATIHSIVNADSLRIDSETGMGIGLINIDKRIFYEYGSGYGLKIDSKEGEYTRVSIRILK